MSPRSWYFSLNFSTFLGWLTVSISLKVFFMAMSREPKRLKEVLDRGQFAVTIEYNPPKGTNIAGVLDNAKQLVGRVHGVNVTDNTAAVVRAGSLSVCRLLYELGHDPVMQMTCRDRNRIGRRVLCDRFGRRAEHPRA